MASRVTERKGFLIESRDPDDSPAGSGPGIFGTMSASVDPQDRGPQPLRGTHRNFLSYIDKSREYYAAHGYENPYRWATNTDAPFARLTKPLADCTVGLVTTSGIHQEDKPADAPPPLPKRPYTWPTDPVPTRMFTDDLSWDKQATHTDDVGSFLPIEQLQRFANEGRIGRLAPRFYGVPTEYSRTKTAAEAQEIEQWCREDEVDVVLLVPL